MTLPIPSTGTDWKGAGVDVVDNRFYSRGGLAAILVRDNRGVATNMSPYAPGTPATPFFSPFAQDGNLRNDMLAMIRVGGIWQVNPNPNLGWWLIGATDEKGGPDRKPSVKHDDAMILQSNFPFDSDITAEGLTIAFTGVEVFKPLMRRLRYNLPLSDTSGNSIVETAGNPGYVLSKPVDADEVDRQVILLFAKKVAGQWLYTAEGYPMCRLTDIGNRKRDKTAADASSLTVTVLPDPNHVDLDPTLDQSTALASGLLIPAMYSEWVAGSGWTAIGGAPVFPGLAPVGTALSATTAVVQFKGAVGGGESIVYTAQKSTTPFSTWTSVTVASAVANDPAEGDVTLNLSGLTTGTGYKVRVIATGSNSMATTSQVSNTFTTD